jgi:hypothetical protein
VEEFGAGSGTEGVQTLPKSALQLIGPHLLSLRCADLEVALSFRRNAHHDLARGLDPRRGEAAVVIVGREPTTR